ncbi:helix-turn-helix transcriptional regulator [Candidatus Palauibacter sp.]|uniref:helix-turn-helix transcriptional regulator n=1 Tax=Candidatus Palauibacter sp. TaxID=3101350 RepID=UPI003B5B36F9
MTMISQDRFDRAVASLYGAALADAAWAPAAGAINDMLRVTGHGLTFADPCQSDPEVLLNRFFTGAERRRDLEHLYFRDYYRRDEAIPRLYELGDGELGYRSTLYTDREKETSAAYNEFRRIAGSQDGLFVVLDGLDGCGVVWSIGDSTQRGGWAQDQVRAIRRLAPHLRQFARVRRAMADARALGASLAELLDNRKSGIIQLDRRGRILEANDRARTVLVKRDGLRDDGGVLAVGTRAEDAELKGLLSRALPAYGAQGTGGSMKVTRDEAGTPLVLEVHPVRKTGTDSRSWEVGALVLIVDPIARPRVDPRLPAMVWGLTPTESRVAVALATGQTAAGVAGELGCAESTVRTHLKRVYRKLGVRKQTELVRRVLSLEALRGSFRQL